MEKPKWSSFAISLYVILLLVLLLISIALNIYQHSKLLEVSGKHTYAPIITYVEIQGGMGRISVFISNGLLMGSGCKFNISLGVKLWDPYTGSKTYTFSFQLYERSEQADTYPDTPVAETTVEAQKDKDALFVVFTSGNLTITAPNTCGLYIYDVCLGTATQFLASFEFPMWIVNGPIITPNV